MVTLARPGAVRPAARLGRRHAATSRRWPSSRSPSRRCAQLLAGLCPGPARARGRGHPDARRRHPALRRGDGPRARRRGPPRARRRRLPAGRRPRRAGRSRRRSRSLIASRLDAPRPGRPQPRRRTPSVLGQSFTLAGLAAVSGPTRAELEPRLRALVRRELFEPRGRSALAGARPVPVRPVAHPRGRLRHPGPPRPAERHLAAARYFESLGDDELAGALAAHYLAAHEASAEGAEADAVAIQARLALRGAAERAATLGAHDQAVAYLRQAIAVTPDPADRGELEIRAARSAGAASRTMRGRRDWRGPPSPTCVPPADEAAADARDRGSCGRSSSMQARSGWRTRCSRPPSAIFRPMPPPISSTAAREPVAGVDASRPKRRSGRPRPTGRWLSPNGSTSTKSSPKR